MTNTFGNLPVIVVDDDFVGWEDGFSAPAYEGEERGLGEREGDV